MMVPTLLFFIFLMWIPFLRGVWMSFHQWPLVGSPEWVGLRNYVELFQSEVFYTSLRATAIFLTTTILQLALALGAALVVANIDYFRDVISGIFLLPYTMPPVVTGTIWLYLADPRLGPIFKLLVNIGILDEAIFWGSNGNMSLAVVTLVAAWTFWPFMFLVILASLESIPDEMYEAARVYGASKVQMFHRITLPQLKSAILVAVSIRVVWNLSKISQTIQMTQGGPGNATKLLAIYLYQLAVNSRELGKAFSVGIILLLITLSVIWIFIKQFEQETTEVEG